MSDRIEPKHSRVMNDLVRGIDDIFNGDVRPKRVAFCLLAAEFGKMEGGRVNYISNANRADMICMVKEWLARMEGRYVEAGGTA